MYHPLSPSDPLLSPNTLDIHLTLHSPRFIILTSLIHKFTQLTGRGVLLLGGSVLKGLFCLAGDRGQTHEKISDNESDQAAQTGG